MAQQQSLHRYDDSDRQRAIEFDIQAQPLELALSAYGVTTKTQLFVDADLVAGLRSTAVKGVFTPASALQALLAGTGLAARAIDDQGFTLVSLSTQRNGSATSARHEVSATVMRFNQYSGLIQVALFGVLCRRPETAPGSYRTLMRLRIDKSGVVTGIELVTSTGEGTRDAAIAESVRGLAIGAPPPVSLPQPVTLLVAGDTPASAYCSEGTSPRHVEIGRERAR